MVEVDAVGKYRRGTTISVGFPTLPSLSLVPRRVELIQKENHHDILKMELPIISNSWFELLKTGVPVSFSWKQGGLSSTWNGYVSFVNKHQVASQIENLLEVHCVGGSFPLKERVTKTFTNTSIPNAVKQIVEKHGFKFVGEDNGVIFENLTLAGHSYWEWIVEHAKKIGYGVSISNMNFCFRPLDKLIDQGMRSIPVLAFTGPETLVNGQFLDRTLDGFKVLHGEHIESDGARRTNKTVSGVDPLTGKIFSHTTSPKSVGTGIRSSVNDVLFSEVKGEYVAVSDKHAKAISSGAAHYGRLNMPALVQCQGDPRIKPFSPVLIQGTGVVTDGYWIAREVKHMFHRLGDYQIEMKVYSDGTGLNNRTSSRPGTDGPVGVVNLTEALKNNGTNPNTLNTAAVAIKSKSMIAKESGQGFKRTPTKWVYSPKGGKH